MDHRQTAARLVVVGLNVPEDQRVAHVEGPAELPKRDVGKKPAVNLGFETASSSAKKSAR
jgi:hypothetical protein